MIPYLEENMIKKVLDERKAFLLAREVFELIGKKKTLMPPKIYLNLVNNRRANDFRAMPAFLGKTRDGTCGIKWVSVFPENRRYGQPTVYATILLNSSKTGALLAILEGNHITAIRTGAAASVATALMANPKPAKLAILGSGLQAEYQLRALTHRYPFKEIAIWGFLAKEAEFFCRRFQPLFPQVRAYKSIPECTDDADIIVTCTPSRKPILMKAWVKKGAHINAIGADAKGKEEIDPALIRSARVVVDEWQQASHSGEINVPFSKGLISRRDIYAELSEIVSGKKIGRSNSDQITIFDSTGLAVLDIYFAHYVYKRCFGEGRGSNVKRL